ncbi:MAG TPA: O-antigen ligase family protein [Clostridiales bacterium]|nr:O-antigen ligase family protein [Clostridiales bacterium]HQP69966.1 O-antigen ligase family protein [Clostridiales bacterium]
MYNRLYTYGYIALCIILAIQIIISVKPKRFFINSIITFWFLIIPVVRSLVFRAANPLEFITGKNWRLDWHLALTLTFLLVLRFFSSKESKIVRSKKMPSYEKSFYLYLIISLVVIIFHIYVGNIAENYINIRLFIYYQAFLLYFSLKKFIDKDTIRCLLKSIMYMAVISSIVSPIQFFYDTWFMRTDRIPRAFDIYQRITGIFQTPYDHAFIICIAMFITIFGIRNYLIKTGLISLFSISLLLTFSRGSWVAVLGVVFIYLFTVENSLFKKIMIYIALASLLWVMFFRAYTPDMSALEDSKMVEERVMSDTATPRLNYYTMVIYTILDKWIVGYGDKENNEVYYKWMYVAGGKDWALGKQGGIHNLILEELFLKGLFTTILMLAFFLSFYKYCYDNSRKQNNYLYLLSLYYTLCFFAYMQTAAAFLNAYSGILVIVMVAIISSVYYNDIDISDYEIIRREKNKIVSEDDTNRKFVLSE